MATTAAMLQAQEAPYFGQPAPQPRPLTTILLMLMAQEHQYSESPRHDAQPQLALLPTHEPPRDIGETALCAGIDPAIATEQDWRRVLDYVMERVQYHSLRSCPEWLPMVVDRKAKMRAVEGWAFDGWQKMRVGITGRKGRQEIKTSLKPSDMTWPQFYQHHGKLASAYLSLADELDDILN